MLTRNQLVNFSASMAIMVMALPRPAAAIEPMTVIAVVGVANTVMGLFGPKGGDPGIAIAQANYELLKELHGRLDQVENGIGHLIKEVAGLPSHMVKSGLRTQEMLLNNKIVAVATNYLSIDIPGLNHDLEGVSPGSPEADQIMAEFRDQVRNRLELIEQDRSTLAQRSDINALGLVTAAWTEITMRADIDRRPGRLLAAAKQYRKYFANILDSSHNGSLVWMLDDLKAKLKVNEDALLDHVNAKQLEGTHFQSCADLQVEKYYPKRCWRTVMGMGARAAEKMGVDPGQIEYDCSYSQWEHANYRNVHFTIWSIPIYSGSAHGHLGVSRTETKSATPDDPKCTVSRDSLVAFRADYENRYQSAQRQVDLINRQRELLTYLETLQTAVRKADRWLASVAANDGRIAEVGMVRGTLTQFVDAPVNEGHQVSVGLEQTIRDQVASGYIENLRVGRERIDQLVRHHDARIREQFRKAANAAKNRRIMGFINLAAQSYALAYQINQSLAASDAPPDAKATDATGAAGDPAERSEAEPGRSTSSTDTLAEGPTVGRARKLTKDMLQSMTPAQLQEIARELKVERAEEILRELRASPIDWSQQPTQEEVFRRWSRVNEGLRLLNNTPDTTADTRWKRSLTWDDDALAIGGVLFDALSGSPAKATADALIFVNTPVVIGDSTLSGLGARNAIRQALNSEALDALEWATYHDMPQTLWSVENWDKLPEHPVIEKDRR